MVSCKKLAQNLSAYIEGDVDRELCGEIERHLSHCRRCSVLLDSVRKVLIISGSITFSGGLLSETRATEPATSMINFLSSCGVSGIVFYCSAK